MAEQFSSSDSQLHSEQLFDAEPRFHLTDRAVLPSDTQTHPSTLTGKHSNTEQGQLKLSHQLGRAGIQQKAAPRQQACATDDGDFERMMARFAELEKQEAAQSGKTLAGSPGVALAQQPGPQQATVAAIQACPAGKQGKLVSGLKRGFLSGTKSKNTTMKQANTSANPVHATGSTNGSKASPSSKFAVSMDHIVFTGSIVEHQDPQATDLQGGHNAGRLSGNDSRTSMSGRADIAAGSMAACTAPERLSKFKQARSAVSTHR